MLVEIEKVSKAFPGVQALSEVSMSIRKNEIFGLVGENGSGKSTLMNILVGVYAKDSGEIKLEGELIDPKNPLEAGKLGIFEVFQQSSMIYNLAVYENFFLGHEKEALKSGLLDTATMKQKTRQALEKLKVDVDPQARTGDLDIARRFMVELARALYYSERSSRFPTIVLDEVTAPLTESEVETLFQTMESLKDKVTFIFISHRLAEVIKLCDRLCVLKDGKVVGILDQSENKYSEHELHKLMVGRSRDVAFYKENKQINPSEKIMLTAKNLTKSGTFYDITFDLHQGEILGIGGVTGSGKTELGKALIGALMPDSGEVEVQGRPIVPRSVTDMTRLGVSYLPPEKKTEGVALDQSVRWNISLPALSKFLYKFLPLINVALERNNAKECVKKLDIKTPSIETRASSLSGGNQQKLVLAKWLTKTFKVLVADNPTRGVDVGAKEEIYDILRELAEGGSSILLITDDLLELIGLSANIIIMKDGRIAKKIETPSEKKPKEEEVISYMV